MTIPGSLLWKVAPYAVAAVLLAFLVRGCQTDAVLSERIRVQDSTVKALRVNRQRVDTIFTRDTIRLTSVRTRRDTVLATVDHYLHDTVAVPVTIVREVVKADSVVIGQCLTAVHDCEARVVVRDTMIHALSVEKDLWKAKASPSLFHRLSLNLLWLGAGYLAGRVVK